MANPLDDLSKLNLGGLDSTQDPGILPPPPGEAGFSFAAAPVSGGAAPAPFSFNLPPAPPDDNDDDDESEEDDDDEDGRLPAAVLGRVLGLKALDEKRGEVMKDYAKERAALEAKYASKINPIFEERSKVVRGELEPTLSEADKETVARAGTADDAANPETGVPDFWLSACGRHEAFQHFLEEGDIEALKYLVDVRCVDDDDLRGFSLEFEFSENPHFSDAVLKKSYKIPNLIDANGQPELEKIEGTEISWKNASANLCHREVKKTQKSKRGKNAGQKRVVTKLEPVASFFHFFDSIKLPGTEDAPEGDDDDDEPFDEELRDKIDNDVELAFALRNQIVPHAILWFTGEAVDSDDEDDDDFDPEDDEDD